MDCNLPGMDGFEATEIIRARESAREYRSTPIVAITAGVMKGDPGKVSQSRHG